MVAPGGGGAGGGPSRWPAAEELDIVRKKVAEISGRDEHEVRIAACPYRICPLGAHIDHQVLLQSGQFEGVIRFRVDDLQKPIDKPENINWESYARGAVYALQNSGYDLRKGIIGYISGVKGLDSSGLSSSAAVGIAYLLALEHVNDLVISPVDNIQLDKYIENKYLGLKNGILDPSAILLSRYGCLTFMDCKGCMGSWEPTRTWTVDLCIWSQLHTQLRMWEQRDDPAVRDPAEGPRRPRRPVQRRRLQGLLPGDRGERARGGCGRVRPCRVRKGPARAGLQDPSGSPRAGLRARGRRACHIA